MSALYNPPAFRVDDARALGDCIDALVFATLISNGPDGPEASQLPLLLDRDAGPLGTLRGHLARANAHAGHLDGEPALVLFQGPAHYVSPSWYPSKAATGQVVPTWNYVAVHARGRVTVRDDRAWLGRLVGALTERMEGRRETPWSVADAPGDYVERLLGHIVGVELVVEHLEGKFKLSQNRGAADRAGVAAALEAERPDVSAALGRLSAFASEP